MFALAKDRRVFPVVLACIAAVLAPSIARAAAGSSLAAAKRLYARGDYKAASIELHRVADMQPDPTQQTATFWLGKALYQLGFYQVALGRFDAVLRAKTSRHRSAALIWLAKLARKLPNEAGIPGKLQGFSPRDFRSRALAGVRDDLCYLLGRHHYGRGAHARAIALFASVSAKSALYPKARLMLGVTHVRKRAAKRAAAAFKDVLRYAQRHVGQPGVTDVAELALLNLARVFYSTKQYTVASKYYGRLPATSRHRFIALLEQAWALFGLRKDSRVLDNLRALKGATTGLPEAYVLEATLQLRRKRRRDGLAALAPLLSRYPALIKALEAVVKDTKDPFDFFVLSHGLLRPQQRSTPVKRLLLHVLSGKQVQRSFAYVDELNRELGAFHRAPPAWKATAVAGVVLQDVTLAKSLAERRVGVLARQGVLRLIGGFKRFLAQGRKLRKALRRLR